MVFKINGTDITPYIANGGLQYTRNDLDGPNAGRALDGTMYRDRVATKDKWTVNCRPLTAQETATLLTLIEPEYVNITVSNPKTNTTRTYQAYSNNVPAQFLMIKNGVEYWTGISFPLIER